MTDPMKTYQRAMESLSAKRFNDALTDFIWIQEHAAEFGREYQGLRRTYALSGWIELARIHPPALDALKDLQQSLSSRLAVSPDDAEIQKDVTALTERFTLLS